MGSTQNTSEASQNLLPLLTIRAPPFNEALDWLKFSYTADQTGAYIEPLSTILVQSVVQNEILYST